MIEDKSPSADCQGPESLPGRFSTFPVLYTALATLFLAPGTITLAQPAARPAEGAQNESLSKVLSDYQEQRVRLDRERIQRLTRLAGSQKGTEAELTYLEVFRFAIAVDRYADAEPAAEQVIRTGGTSREVEFLAQLVNLIGEAERGDYDGSMRDLKAYLAAPAAGPAPAPHIQTRTLLTIGEAYFRRLVQGRRFDLAREVCELIARKAENPAVRDHFAGYQKRLELVGQPAPAIQGVDADGVDVRLKDLDGKVVLVVFWATWCPPCVEKLPTLKQALERYEKDGFAVLGVNLDNDSDRERLVRQFVVEFGVPWPNVLSGKDQHDIADRYAVSELPANVLIGRDGKVVTFDQWDAKLLEAISEAVKRPRESR